MCIVKENDLDKTKSEEIVLNTIIDNVENNVENNEENNKENNVENNVENNNLYYYLDNNFNFDIDINYKDSDDDEVFRNCILKFHKLDKFEDKTITNNIICLYNFLRKYEDLKITFSKLSNKLLVDDCEVGLFLLFSYDYFNILFKILVNIKEKEDYSDLLTELNNKLE